MKKVLGVLLGVVIFAGTLSIGYAQIDPNEVWHNNGFEVEDAFLKGKTPVEVYEAYVGALKKAEKLEDIASYFSEKIVTGWEGGNKKSLLGMLKIMNALETISFTELEISGDDAVFKREVKGPNGDGFITVTMHQEEGIWKLVKEKF
ncbi:MAG: hypothetical protein ABII88_06735 [Candidatus Omnitrophota bacterium]